MEAAAEKTQHSQNRHGGLMPLTLIMLRRVAIIFTLLLTLSALFIDHAIKSQIEMYQSVRQNLSAQYAKDTEYKLSTVNQGLNDLLANRNALIMLNYDNELERYKAETRLLQNMRSNISSASSEFLIINDGIVLSDRGSCISYQEDLDLIKYMKETPPAQYNRWLTISISPNQYLMKCYKYQNSLIVGIINISDMLSDASSNDFALMITDEDDNTVYTNADLEFTDIKNNPDYETNTAEIDSEDLYFVCAQKVRAGLLSDPVSVILISLLLATVLALISFYITIRKEILVPVNNIYTVSNKIIDGDYETRPDYHCKNKELMRLETAFDSMLDTITNLKLQEYESAIALKDSQLRYLQMQLRPHFFINALSTINSMAYKNDTKSIHEFITVFSRVVRYRFSSSFHTVPLASEIDAVRDYLSLQQMYYQDCFYCYEDIKDEDLQVQVPQMLVLQFVENIFKHTINTDSFTTIFLTSERDTRNNEEMVKITVSDTGKGFSESELEMVNSGFKDADLSKVSGVGLAKASAILRIIYGMDNLIELSNNDPSGAVVSIWVPGKQGSEV